VGRRAAAVLAVLVTGLLLGAVLASCGLPGREEKSSASAQQARTLALARAGFARAAAALRAGDAAAFRDSLASDGTSRGSAARDGLSRVFDTLSGLPWRTFSFSVSPLDRARRVYRVAGSGQLGSAGPSDRLAVVRYLELRPAGEGVVVAADVTPENLRRRYLVALHDPVVLQRPGFIVLADRWARSRAAAVLEAAEQARPRLETLGVDTTPAVVITVFGSAEDVRDALGVKASTPRLAYFSYAPLRVAQRQWAVWDVGVMGPWLRDPGVSTGAVLAHELAHAYTMRWFGGADPPSLLVEGIAEAAEGSPVTPALRREVATGDQLWPLPGSFGVDDVWDGSGAESVSLGYELGGSLVEYVVGHWGPSRLRPFVQEVAAAEPTESGMDAALDDALGVSWSRFFAGWRRYVLRGG
jgi:hypothetical protein